MPKQQFTVFKQVRRVDGSLADLQAVETVYAADMQEVKRMTLVRAPIIQPVDKAMADIREKRFGRPIQWCNYDG